MIQNLIAYRMKKIVIENILWYPSIWSHYKVAQSILHFLLFLLISLIEPNIVLFWNLNILKRPATKNDNYLKEQETKAHTRVHQMSTCTSIFAIVKIQGSIYKMIDEYFR